MGLITTIKSRLIISEIECHQDKIKLEEVEEGREIHKLSFTII